MTVGNNVIDNTLVTAALIVYSYSCKKKKRNLFLKDYTNTKGKNSWLSEIFLSRPAWLNSCLKLSIIAIYRTSGTTFTASAFISIL